MAGAKVTNGKKLDVCGDAKAIAVNVNMFIGIKGIVRNAISLIMDKNSCWKSDHRDEVL